MDNYFGYVRLLEYIFFRETQTLLQCAENHLKRYREHDIKTLQKTSNKHKIPNFQDLVHIETLEKAQLNLEQDSNEASLLLTEQSPIAIESTLAEIRDVLQILTIPMEHDICGIDLKVKLKPDAQMKHLDTVTPRQEAKVHKWGMGH